MALSWLLAIETNLFSLLKHHWGYDLFRPKQEEIIRSLTEGRDVVAIMPTGGGKSLCYQLAAVALQGTAVVISPLIALMRDQVQQLEQIDIPSAFLNSSVPYPEQRDVMRAASQGHYRLLYLSPERLAREDSLEWLRTVPVSFFAIDEAHCISEWGHEFRPEYRQLNRLRVHFPDKPVAAFTASATRRVRHDILHQLGLRNPGKFVLSFYRPNLRILVEKCTPASQERRLLAAIRAHEGANQIIYAPTINRVQETVALLASHRIAAIPYHGKLDAQTREENQERWMSDEVPVLVGTIAFGLGINKPAVRSVIHLSLPKSLEQYYQEAGRAGRDGNPADCVLLWQGRDTGLLAYFIQQIEDREEQKRSWDRYHVMRRFAESGTCRHRQICSHFGQHTSWENCGACDVCGETPDWLEGPASRPTPGRQPAAAPARAVRDDRIAGEAPALADPDPVIVEHLKRWRSDRARRQGVPAYVILHDKALADLARRRPATPDELLEVHGIGEAKAAKYGQDLLQAIDQCGKDEDSAATSA